MRQAGIVTVIVGGVVFIIALAVLDWFALPRVTHTPQGIGIVIHGVTLWDYQTRLPGILTVLAAASVALAAVSLLTDSILAVLAPTCCAFFLLGETFPVGLRDYSLYRVGFWVSTGAAVAMSIGGVLAVTGAARPASRFSS